MNNKQRIVLIMGAAALLYFSNLGNYSGKKGTFFHIRKVDSIKWEYIA